MAWELLGGYIAKNEHLVSIDLSRCRLTDSNMQLLFRGLTICSLEKLDLSYNNFGVDGIRSMTPLLRNAQNICRLDIHDNPNINTECFRLLVEAMYSGGSIEVLRLDRCNIDDMTALDYYLLPRLRHLDLEHNSIQNIPSSLENFTNLEKLYLRNNNIGNEGCRSIAKLLQKDDSRLSDLYLSSTDMGDEEAEILANSLKSNASLETLYLDQINDIKEQGHRAFLKLLNDVSSIERTYNSNHTLTTLILPYSSNATICEMQRHIDFAAEINKSNEGNSHAAGRAKVIQTQLNSQKRKELCHLQVDYSYSSIFAEIEPFLLPEVLALTGGNHGQRELYRMLIATVPNCLLSIPKE